MHYRTRPTRRPTKTNPPLDLPQGIVEGIALLTDADPDLAARSVSLGLG